jgi:hypothetical protein
VSSCAVLYRASCYPVLSCIILYHPVWFASRLQTGKYCISRHVPHRVVPSHPDPVVVKVQGTLGDDQLIW